MAMIQAHTKLCDVIASAPDIIPVLNRFGIMLGTGDKTIDEVCIRHNLDTVFFLCIINTYINDEYFPEKILKSFCATTIVSYLEKTNAYYLHFQLPNIERHFAALISRSGDNNNLGLMKRFFDELKDDISMRIDHDHKQWFPLINNIKNNCNPSEHIDIDSSTVIQDKLNDLKNMFIIHLNGSYDLNLCYGVITSIISLEKDIRQNDRIRNRILIPLFNSLINTTRQECNR